MIAVCAVCLCVCVSVLQVCMPLVFGSAPTAELSILIDGLSALHRLNMISDLSELSLFLHLGLLLFAEVNLINVLS